MRPSAAFILLAPTLLAAQPPTLDEGRLDPAWFGPEAVFQPSKALGFQWLKPGLDLRQRTLQLRAWEPAAWLLGQRARKDQLFLQQVEAYLPRELEGGLRRGLRGALPLSPTEGDLLVSARIVDAVGPGDDYMAMGRTSLSLDVKVVDRGTGALLAAFHETLQGSSAEAVAGQYGRWCEALGRHLAASAAPPVALKPVLAPAAMVPKPTLAPPVPVFDLEGALARIEGLRRDGLLSEEDYQALRKKAADKAAPKAQ
jgi:hypothetical protein